MTPFMTVESSVAWADSFGPYGIAALVGALAQYKAHPSALAAGDRVRAQRAVLMMIKRATRQARIEAHQIAQNTPSTASVPYVAGPFVSVRGSNWTGD